LDNVLWDIWILTIFILFSFIFLILLFFSFIFFWKTMKKAHDKEVTWQVMWCDIISLEPDGRIWKMISEHLEYTWWPWVRSKVSMRLKHGHKGSVKTIDSGLHLFLFSLFHFIFSFLFSIFRTAQVRGYQSRCHISHNLMA